MPDRAGARPYRDVRWIPPYRLRLFRSQGRLRKAEDENDDEDEND